MSAQRAEWPTWNSQLGAAKPVPFPRKRHPLRPPRAAIAEHGGEYPDNMPQAIIAIDPQGRSCVYVPVRENGRVVDGVAFELADEGR